MNVYALGLAAILYLIVCISFLRKKDYPMAFIFMCYAASNLGFIWYALSGKKEL